MTNVMSYEPNVISIICFFKQHEALITNLIDKAKELVIIQKSRKSNKLLSSKYKLMHPKHNTSCYVPQPYYKRRLKS